MEMVYGALQIDSTAIWTGSLLRGEAEGGRDQITKHPIGQGFEHLLEESWKATEGSSLIASRLVNHHFNSMHEMDLRK